MKHIISISEAIAEIAVPDGGNAEVHAEVEGTYDEEKSLLLVTLQSEVRPMLKDTHLERPSWLPASQSLKEHVAEEEATTLARDIFRHWVEKVRRAIPAGSLNASAAET